MNDDRELEALLRRALHEHAENVVPTGDGLTKIRQRAANRRRRLVWLRPSMAVAAAAVAAVAAIAIPTAIHRMDNGDSGTQAGSRPSAHSAISGGSSTSAKRSPTPHPTPLAERPLTPAAMSWPYSSKAVAARSGDPSLTNPEQLAKTFVGSFIGSDKAKPLLAKQTSPQNGPLTIDLRRRDGMLVSRVQLDRVAKAFYVVAAANGTNVALSESSRTSNSITVDGTFEPDNKAAAIWAGADTAPGKSKSRRLTDTTSDVASPWQITLNAPGTIAPGPKILAAWTVDPSGRLLDFSAMAAN